MGRAWFALLTLEVANAEPRAGPWISISGVTRLSNLSTREILAIPREGKRRAPAIAAAQRALARERSGSK